MVEELNVSVASYDEVCAIFYVTPSECDRRKLNRACLQFAIYPASQQIFIYRAALYPCRIRIVLYASDLSYVKSAYVFAFQSRMGNPGQQPMFQVRAEKLLRFRASQTLNGTPEGCSPASKAVGSNVCFQRSA